MCFLTLPSLQSVAACLHAVGGVTTPPCLQQAIEDILTGDGACEPHSSGAHNAERLTQSCLRWVPARLVYELLVPCLVPEYTSPSPPLPSPPLPSPPCPLSSRVVFSLPPYLLFRDSASAAQCPTAAGLENLAALLQQAIVSPHLPPTLMAHHCCPPIPQAPHTSQHFLLSSALTRHVLQVGTGLEPALWLCLLPDLKVAWPLMCVIC